MYICIYYSCIFIFSLTSGSSRLMLALNSSTSSGSGPTSAECRNKRS